VQDQHVQVRPAADNMVWVSALLTSTEGAACSVALEREAAAAKAAGDERSRGQIKAAVLVERITGRRPAAPADLEIELVMTDKTLLGDSQEPALIPGFGPLPADEARRMVLKAAKAWVRRLFTHPESGALVAMDSRRRRFDGQLRHLLVLRDGVCANAWCDAPVRHADHEDPVREGGETSAANGAGLCETCNYTKDLPGWSSSVITTPDGNRILDLVSPTGHRQRSRSPVLPGGPDPTRARVDVGHYARAG
jgi:hypothetical protein